MKNQFKIGTIIEHVKTGFLFEVIHINNQEVTLEDSDYEIIIEKSIKQFTKDLKNNIIKILEV